MPEQQTFLSMITGSFSTPAAENPTVAMIEAAYEHHHIDARNLNCDVAPDVLADAVRGARAMGWVGFNCSMPHKVSVIKYLDGLVGFDRPRVVRVLERIAADLDNLSLVPKDPHADKESNNQRHRDQSCDR